MVDKQILLDENEVRSVLRCIRIRQDECRRVTKDADAITYDTFFTLDCKLEKLKMKIANQLV